MMCVCVSCTRKSIIHIHKFTYRECHAKDGEIMPCTKLWRFHYAKKLSSIGDNCFSAGYCSQLLLRSDTNHRENVVFRPPPVESLQKNRQDVARYKNVNQQRVCSHPFQYCGPVSIAPHINHHIDCSEEKASRASSNTHITEGVQNLVCVHPQAVTCYTQ